MESLGFFFLTSKVQTWRQKTLKHFYLSRLQPDFYIKPQSHCGSSAGIIIELLNDFICFKILPIKITVRRCLISSLRSAHLSKSEKLIIFPSFSGVLFCFIGKESDSIKMLSKIKGASNFCEGGLGKRVFNLYVEERMK